MTQLTKKEMEKLEKEFGEDWFEYIIFDDSDDGNGYLVDQKNKFKELQERILHFKFFVF